MTLSEFITKYDRKIVDYDGAYGAQCVDLFRQYSKDVLGIKEHTGVVSGAKDLFLDFDNMPLMRKYFVKTCKPCIGDIVVWKSTKGNPYGHVAIVLADLGKDLIVFEQDGFTQDGAKLNVRATTGVAGFLRSKV